MGLNLSAYDALLKDVYDGAVREQLNNEIPMFRILDESDKSWSGRRVVFPIHTSRNSGVGSRAESGTLPTAGNQAHSLAVVSATYHYGRGEITGQTLAAGKNAFAEALSMELDGLMRDLKVDLGRQTWGTGDGRLAQVGADSLSASGLSVYNRFAEPGQPGARFITQSMVIDAGTVASPLADFSSQTVASVNISQNPATTVDTVTITASSLTVSQCDTYLFNRGAGGAGIECLGIQALVDNYTESNYWGSNAFYGATIQGIARNTVSVWNSLILGNSGTARLIDGNLMQIAFDRIHEETGEEPDLIMGHHSVVRAFLDAVSADRRYASKDFDAGRGALSYNGVSIERDRMAPFNSLLVGKKSSIKKFTLKDIGFADRDGAVLSRVDDKDAYEFYLNTYFNLGIDGNAKSLLMIRDIKTEF